MVNSVALQAVFIDRDGTIGGTGRFIHPNDFVPYPDALTCISWLKQMGLKVFAFTNQHRIALGQASLAQFNAQFAAFGFDQAYICPHEEVCECRKPQPGMLLAAAAQHGLDLSRCVVIGDVGETDMLAAHAVGAIKIIVRTGWGEPSLTTYRSRWMETDPDYVADDLSDAVRWIAGKHQG